MDFFAVCFVVDIEQCREMRSFRLLISKELILVLNWSLLYLHSNDMNSLKKKRVIAIIIAII